MRISNINSLNFNNFKINNNNNSTQYFTEIKNNNVDKSIFEKNPLLSDAIRAQKLSAPKFNLSFGHDRDDLSYEELYMLHRMYSVSHFRNVAETLTKKDKQQLVKLIIDNPKLEDIIAGDYVMDTGNERTNKKIIDLKSIETHNKTHPENPIDFISYIKNNPAVFCTLATLKNHPTAYGFEFCSDLPTTNKNEYINVETKIKYRNNEIYEQLIEEDSTLSKISKKTEKELKNAKISENFKSFFADKEIKPELKKCIFELLDVPYFTAAASNLDVTSIKDVAEIIIEQEPLAIAALKGRVKLTNGKDVNVPLINLEKIAKHNKLYPTQPKVLINEILINPLYMAVLAAIEDTRKEEKCPNLITLKSLDYNLDKAFNIKDFTIEKLNTPFFSRLKNDYEYFIVFDEELKPKGYIGDNQTKNIGTKSTNFHTPKVVKNLLSSSNLSEKDKKTLYNLGKIPMLYENIQDLNILDVAELIKLHNEYGKNFENLLSGKFQILVSNPRTINKTSFITENLYDPTNHQPEYFMEKVLNSQFNKDILSIFSEIQKNYKGQGKLSNVVFTYTTHPHTQAPIVKFIPTFTNENKLIIGAGFVSADDVPNSVIQKLKNVIDNTIQIKIT